MNNKKELLDNINRIHTTEMGVIRIKRNLKIEEDVVAYCKQRIVKKDCQMERKGKNWYATIEGCVFTINAHSYTIITAHKLKCNAKK